MGWALSFLFQFCPDLCQNTVVILTEIALFEVKAGYLMPGGGGGERPRDLLSQGFGVIQL